MGQDLDPFVSFMLDKAQKKDKPTEPQKMLSPERGPDPTVQRGMSKEDEEAVLRFTNSLQKKNQR